MKITNKFQNKTEITLQNAYCTSNVQQLLQVSNHGSSI